MIRDLLGELEQFNQQLGDLNDFISNGNDLLNSEKPLGHGLAKLEEQLQTCQVQGKGRGKLCMWGGGGRGVTLG